MNKTTIETVTGKFIDLADPKIESIDIVDIAWSLSRMPRFVGHTITEIPYSVAQHCCFVANNVKTRLETRYDCIKRQGESRKDTTDRTILQALMHDASESYTSDLPGPLKHIPELRAVIKPIEHSIQEVIFSALYIEMPTESEERIIKLSDFTAQKIEGHAFMESRGKSWDLPEVSIEELQNFEAPLCNIDAYHKFIDMYNKYK